MQSQSSPQKKFTTTTYAAIAAADFSLPYAAVERTVGIATKDPSNPLFSQDTPWEERIDNGYPNAIRSPNGEWRLFYGTCEKTCALQLLLYANSSDGLHWTKPDLGLFDIGTVRPDLKAIGTTNNVILEGGGIGVTEDLEATDPSRRFIAFGPGCYQPSFRNRSCAMAWDRVSSGGWQPQSLHQDTAYSADGLVWSHARSIPWPPPQRYDCHNNLVRAPKSTNGNDYFFS